MSPRPRPRPSLSQLIPILPHACSIVRFRHRARQIPVPVPSIPAEPLRPRFRDASPPHREHRLFRLFVPPLLNRDTQCPRHPKSHYLFERCKVKNPSNAPPAAAEVECIFSSTPTVRKVLLLYLIFEYHRQKWRILPLKGSTRALKSADSAHISTEINTFGCVTHWVRKLDRGPCLR